jgi:hypothetical protein
MKRNISIPILTLITGLIFSSCHKQEESIPGLKGTWIEVDTQSDTIIFNTDLTIGYLNLNRGYELMNGYSLPKTGSGPYSYTIKDDSIRLLWAFSSFGYGSDYFFKFNESNMTFNIGSFGSIETDKTILTFQKKSD